MLHGKRILITAGPTYERIDPVRFIGNFSSGKMGFALAEACAEHGAEVLLVAGPVQLSVTHRRIRRINVVSAAEMYETVMEHFATCDGAILCAAVADFTPLTVADTKLKRGTDTLTLNLKPTKDIAAALGACKRNDQFLVGFALETDNEEQHALDKLRRKNFDFIVLNSLNDSHACFGYDTNKITVLTAAGERVAYPLKSKTEVAADIVRQIENIVAK